MQKLTLITGLPYSGKTTKAREIIKESKPITFRVSPKEISSMLFASNIPTSLQETFIETSVYALLNHLILITGSDVVIDCDSLNSMEILKYRSWCKRNKVKFQHIYLKSSMDTCIERAQKDNKNYRVSNIVNEALKYKLYKTKVMRPFYVVDVTNPATITDKAIKKMEEAAKNKKDIILISTRPESERSKVEEMIRDKKLFAMGLPINTLILAPNGNRMSHITTKKWIMKTYNLTEQPVSHK